MDPARKQRILEKLAMCAPRAVNPAAGVQPTQPPLNLYPPPAGRKGGAFIRRMQGSEGGAGLPVLPRS